MPHQRISFVVQGKNSEWVLIKGGEEGEEGGGREDEEEEGRRRRTKTKLIEGCTQGCTQELEEVVDVT